jgi:hypothetical protein
MSRPEWMSDPNIRPYVFARKANRPIHPGTAYEFKMFDREPIVMEPLEMGEVYFANQIMNLDQVAFNANGLLTPRWVFFDCAVMPGLIAGFAMRTNAMPAEMKAVLNVNNEIEWTPISLWVGMPTPEPGRWMAQNFGSINTFVDRKHRLSGLGYLSKAYALWYGNITELYGVAQWNSPALKLHANYGPFEVVTSYTPIHDYANSVTYRMWVDTEYWQNFLTKKDSNTQFQLKFSSTQFKIKPLEEESLIEIQSMIETEQGPFFLDPVEIFSKPIGSELLLYKPKN